VPVVGQEGLAEAARDAFQVQLVNAVVGALQQAHPVLAKCQDVETAVAAQQGQERLRVKAIRDNHQVLERHGETVQAQKPRRLEKGQTVRLVLPEGNIFQ